MRLHDVSKASDGTENRILSDDQLKQLQEILLMMLSDLKQICDNNNLRFVLIGGTGIGAMRHQGFIPWDDDVDVAMPRNDYEKLLKVIRRDYNDKYLISDARDRDNYGKIIPKLRLKNTEYRTVLDVKNENTGIRLDIFIIENTFDNVGLRYAHGVACMFLGFALSCSRLYQNRDLYQKLTNSMGFKVKTGIGRLFSFASLNKWALWTDRCHAFCGNDHSKYVTVPSDGPHYFRGLTKRENLCRLRDIKFEGIDMWVPYGVDMYLRGIYGDYMKIPPESKRVRGKYLSYDPGKYANIRH